MSTQFLPKNSLLFIRIGGDDSVILFRYMLLLIKHGARVDVESVLDAYYTTKISSSKILNDLMLPHIFVKYGEDKKSIFDRTNSADDNKYRTSPWDGTANADFKKLINDTAAYEEKLKELHRDTSSFFSRLPSDVLKNYVIKYVTKKAPTDAPVISDAARAAAGPRPTSPRQ